MDYGEITAACAVATLIGAAAAWLVTRGGGSEKVSQRSETAERFSQAALAKIEVLTSQFAEHKTEDAAAFARLEATVGETGRALVAIEGRLINSIEDMGKAVDRMTSRLDEFLTTFALSKKDERHGR